MQREHLDPGAAPQEARALALAPDSQDVDTPFGLDAAAEATIDHMRLRGIKENTLRALASDLRYLAAWCQAATDAPLPLPTPPALVRRFIAHHLWDPAVRATNPDHGMPDPVAERLESEGFKQPPASGVERRPAAPATVRRRLASLSTYHRQHPSLRHANPLKDPDVTTALRAATRGSAKIRADAHGARAANRGLRKSEIAIVADTLEQMIAVCEREVLDAAEGAPEWKRGLRDRALLLFMWSTGGRRRAEVAGLMMDQLRPAEDGYLVDLGTTKSRDAETAERQAKLVPLVGSSAPALNAWLTAADLEQGRVFRGIDRHGNIGSGLSGMTVNRIIKNRAIQAGIVTPEESHRIAAHGMRSGFLTEAARRGIPMADAMDMSDHRDERSVAGYWAAEDALRNPAARLRDTGV